MHWFLPHRAKTSLAAFLVAGFCAGSHVSAQTPLIQYNFDEGTGTAATNSGSLGVNSNGILNNGGTAADLHGANGSGVSGRTGDYSLNLTAANGMGSASSTNNAGEITVGNPNAVQSLVSFTLSGWIKPDEIIGNNARMFVFTPANTTGFQLLATGGTGTTGTGGVTLTVNGVATSSAPSYTTVGAYMFFAVTYNGAATSNNTSFYVGTSPGALTLVNTGTLNAGTVLANTSGTAFLIANDGAGVGTGARPLDAALDQIAIYGSFTDGSGALTLSQLNTASAYAAVPEPGTAWHVALASVVFVGVWAFRRRHVNGRN